MAMVVKNNMSAVNTLNTLNKNQSLLGKSLQKVSSGMKINSAQDDASGYAISERMRVMLRSLDQANQNTQNGSSLMKVAEGSVSNTVEILKTLKEKAINAATDTNTDEDRAIIQKEIDQLVDQIDDNALITFNGKYLLDGSKSAAGDATYNTWTNQSLSEGTTATTKLTELKARDGEALTIETSDKVTVSYVQNGKTYTTTATVGDKSFIEIFKLAEDINTDTQTFATAKNETVQKIGGISSTSVDGDAIGNAINYLQEVLSFYVADANSVNAAMSPIAAAQASGSVDYISYNYDTDKIALADTFVDSNGATVAAIGLDDDKKLGIEDTHNGELYQKVADAIAAYTYAKDAAGDASSGYAQQFINALNTYNENHTGSAIQWNYNEGSIDAMEDKVRATSDSAVINAYNAYKQAVDAKDDAKTALNSAIQTYNEGLAQLDALLRLNDLETAKTAYNAAVNAYMKEVTSDVQAADKGTEYVLPKDLAYNTVDLSYKVGTDSTDDRDEITSNLEQKLYDILTDAVIDTTAAADGNLETRVRAIIYADDANVTEVDPSIYETEESDLSDAKTALGTAITDAGTEGATSTSLVSAIVTAVDSAIKDGTYANGAAVKTATAAAKTALEGLWDSNGGIADTITAVQAYSSTDPVAMAVAAALAAVDTTTVKDENTFKAAVGALVAVADAEADVYDAQTAYDTAVKTETDSVKSANDTYAKVVFHKIDADDTESQFVGTPANVIAAAKKVDTASSAITTDYSAKLKLSYDVTLADYTGPTILTGSNVGVDPAGKIVTTLDGTAGLTFVAANSGTNGQISGFTVSISDSDGNVRKSVNTVLNAWSTSVYGKNASAKDNALTFQIGSAANQSITVDMADMRAEALGLKGKDGKVVDVSTKENANAAISVFENALQKALDVQTTVGAIEARLEYTSSNLTTSSENVQAAESTIRDADMAKEMTNYTKNNVLLQAAQSMLAQANQNSSAVLSLLQ